MKSLNRKLFISTIRDRITINRLKVKMFCCKHRVRGNLDLKAVGGTKDLVAHLGGGTNND